MIVLSVLLGRQSRCSRTASRNRRARREKHSLKNSGVSNSALGHYTQGMLTDEGNNPVPVIWWYV